MSAASASVQGRKRGWAPHAGSQALFLACPVFEVLYTGARGSGKSQGLLMSYARFVGKGYGRDWVGIIFRQSYPQLEDIVRTSLALFSTIFPEAKFNQQTRTWTWPTGEKLLFRHLETENDYWAYHGHQYPFIGFEELTNWPTPGAYLAMFSCCRSARADMPRMVRATTNPYGPGFQWIKARFKLPHMLGRIVRSPPASPGAPALPDRTALHGKLRENATMLAGDPAYEQRIAAAATSKMQQDAWLLGSWDITGGGMFDDLWSTPYHVCRPFRIPSSWRVVRAFDWGSSKPFSVGWWAFSDGTPPPERPDLHTVRGDAFRIAEWYGWDGSPNKGSRMLAGEVARGILLREAELDLAPGVQVRPGAADNSIWTADPTSGYSVAEDMRKHGIKFVPADKSSGSRRNGWEAIRKRLKAMLPVEHPAHLVPPRPSGTPRESPGLVVFDVCDQWIRTVPVLPRDKKDPDDVDTDAEDHAADETRYVLGSEQSRSVRQEDF